MKASNPSTCSRCGTPIPPGATDQLCPACLLSGALKAPDDVTVVMPTQSPSPPGHTTGFPGEFGGYILVRLLGRGGMGTVYEAEQLATGRRVALKVLGQQLDSPEMRQRFLREGRLAAGVTHPNSLYVFGSEEIAGVPVITMEIAGSGTLKDKLKQRGPLPVSEAVDAILDVVAGLEAAFQAGVLHRDIKPSNCFVSPDGSVKIGDFGLSVSTLAKDDSYVTASGVVVGTPAYASPEQLRGDALDLRADIYSVGATLYTLLTDRVPFEGDNAVQVVANAVNQEPTPLLGLRPELPPQLARVVNRCLAKEPGARYADYTTLRKALLPFSSREPEPASILVRVSAGWIDYLVALLPPYVILMFLVGAGELLVRPLVERTLFSAKYYLLLLGLGCLYFSLTEGLWGAGLGKWLKGLQVVRPNGRPPGFARALIRILIPLLCVEGVRMPLTMAFISEAQWTGLQTAGYVVAAVVCGWIPVLLIVRARRENGFATVWDRASGTRVVVKPRWTARPTIEPLADLETPAEGTGLLGPYQVTRELVPERWIIGTDPVLRRQVWLLRRTASQPSLARRNVARPGRQRWLQAVKAGGDTWDVFEATPGVPFSRLVGNGRKLPWSTLRLWLHDLASELWKAAADLTLPAELSPDHVWITAQGRAVVLDQPWPEERRAAEGVRVGDLAGQQRFLNTIAAQVDVTRLPLHARPALKNLAEGKYEKLSFLTGTLRGLLERPAEVSRAIRVGSLFLLPFYVWITVFVGYYHDKPWNDALSGIVVVTALVALGAALVQLLALPFRTTLGHFIFRLAVVNSRGKRAGAPTLLLRWAIVWLPLLLPLSLAALLMLVSKGLALLTAAALLGLWLGAAVHTVVQPHRGMHDRVAGTWVVRR